MQYRIKPMGKTCAATGQPLQPGAVCHSVLVEDEDGYKRLDFSSEGWNGVPDDAVGYWRCQVPLATEPTRRPLDTEALFDFFSDLSDQPNVAQEKFRYIAALSLLQKRRLVLEDSHQEDEICTLHLRGSQGEGPFEVRDHQLPEADIEKLQDELALALAEEEQEESDDLNQDGFAAAA